jgi:hypothetical protein
MGCSPWHRAPRSENHHTTTHNTHIRALLPSLNLGCRTGTGTGTGEPVRTGSPGPGIGQCAMPNGGWDRKVKTKLGFFFTAIDIQAYTYMRLQNQATGTAHARLPSGDHGPWTIPPSRLLPPQHAANRPAGRCRCGWALIELKQQPTRACRPVPVCGTTTKLITGRYRPVGQYTGYRYRCRALRPGRPGDPVGQPSSER